MLVQRSHNSQPQTSPSVWTLTSIWSLSQAFFDPYSFLILLFLFNQTSIRSQVVVTFHCDHILLPCLTPQSAFKCHWHTLVTSCFMLCYYSFVQRPLDCLNLLSPSCGARSPRTPWDRLTTLWTLLPQDLQAIQGAYFLAANLYSRLNPWVSMCRKTAGAQWIFLKAN